MNQLTTLINKKIINIDKLYDLPAAVYWKDKNSVYQCCNDYMLDLIGIPNLTKFTGKTDYDHFWHAYADLYISEDKQTIQTQKSIIKTTEVPSINGEITNTLTIKAPLIFKGAIQGIFGISILTSVFEFKELLKTMRTISSSLSDVFCLDENNIHLSPREIECARLLLGGYRTKEIANHLHLSPRTVESHITNSKHKLGCLSLTDLRRKLFKQGLSPAFINE